MAPTRTTRSVSTKPASKTATHPTQKPISRAKSHPIKRAASPDRPPSPPPKRNKTAETAKPDNTAPTTRKPRSKAPATVKKPETARSKDKKPHINGLATVPEDVPSQKPYFNPLPTPPPKTRPTPLLWSWGAGNFGQFGMGPDVLSELPKPKKNLWVEEKMQEGLFGDVGAGIESIAAGGMHTLFIDESGTIWSCGVNDDAALGRITKDVPDPNNPDKFLDIDELTSIPHALTSLVNEQFRAVSVSTGDNICAAISSKGDLRVWGSFRANDGSLGFSGGAKHQFTPAPILELGHKLGDTEKVSFIAAGDNHLLVLTTHGHIYTWGAGEQSQLGHKVISRRKIAGTVPYKITLGNRSKKAVIIGAGAFHSFAVDESGDVWGWGLNNLGQTGTGTKETEVALPTKVVGLSKDELGGATIVAIDGGNHHTLFLTSDGKVYACGRANSGQLGIPEDHPAFKNRGDDSDHLREPVMVEFPDDDDPVTRISVGAHNNAAVTEGGALYAWGQGPQSELGLGKETEVRTPRVVVRREGGSWAAVDVDCGGQHTLGLFRKKT